jgi:Bacterial extracellular solute-binding proteins, family 3
MALSFLNSWRLHGRLVVGCCSLIFLLAVPAKADEVRIAVKVQGTQQGQQDGYFSNLLMMALEASKADNEIIEIIYSSHDYSQARWISMLQKDTSNFVIWTMTDSQREQQLRPIRIPLSKGLFGYRVLVIRKQEQVRFDQVKNIDDLANFIGGQGTHWPDTRILKANGLKLVTAENTESLFRMIEAKRFDYFPRGTSEAWFELLERKENNLTVEKNLLFYYPADIYFFVNKNNEALANRIEKGLEILIDNGEFDRFFYSHPRVSTAFNKLKDRRLIKLKNPYLPPETPVDNPRYWIDLSAMEREVKPDQW